MKTVVEYIRFDEMSIPITRSARRKSVGITVDRDGAVLVSAPIKCEVEKIEEYVRSKSLWIHTKLLDRERLTGSEPHRKTFVDGANFTYLGTNYRLKLVDKLDFELSPPLELQSGWFELDRKEAGQAAVLFRRWYASVGLEHVRQIVACYSDRVATPSAVEIRDIGFRWGSCTTDGKVLISWRAIQLPREILTYVVVHEMVHLLYHNHSEAFWAHLNRVMPDYEQRKIWLAENGERFAAEF